MQFGIQPSTAFKSSCEVPTCVFIASHYNDVIKIGSLSSCTTNWNVRCTL